LYYFPPTRPKEVSPLKLRLIEGWLKGGVQEGAKPPLFISFSPSPRMERGTQGVRLINKNKGVGSPTKRGGGWRVLEAEPMRVGG